MLRNFSLTTTFLVLLLFLFFSTFFKINTASAQQNVFTCYYDYADNRCRPDPAKNSCVTGLSNYEIAYCAMYNGRSSDCFDAGWCCGGQGCPTITPSGIPLPPTSTPQPSGCYSCYWVQGFYQCLPHNLNAQGHCDYYADPGTCTNACNSFGGSYPPGTKFRCNCEDNTVNQCTPSPYGTLDPSDCSDCIISCGEVAKAAIFCDSKGDPTSDSGPDTSPNPLYTALGCISWGGKATIKTLLDWSVGLGSGIGVILTALSGIQIALASGDPKRIKAAKELLMGALTGLFILALCVVALNFIGVQVLGLPAFKI